MGERSLMQVKLPCRLPSSFARPMEAGMTARKTQDTNGSLGTESAALREELERLAAAIERAAKSEGAEAMKAAGETAREILARATTMVDELAGRTDAAKAIAEGRVQLEAAIRDRPLAAIAIAALAGFVLAALVRR
jgi:ElaB/YqjD/DUF883 family membrane-anchored ribosome-binding protein